MPRHQQHLSDMTARTMLGFLLTVAEPERRCRLRELRALATLLLGPAHRQPRSLPAAVTDPTAAPAALAALDHLPALPRRRLLATFGSLAL